MKPDRVYHVRRRLAWLAALVLLAGCGAPVLESTAPAAQVASPAPSAQPSVAPRASGSPGALPSALATATPAAVPTVEASPAASPAPAAEFSGQRALETVSLLADTIGSRPAGSDAERRAADALAAELENLGWSAELQSFPIRSFQDRGSTLRVEDGSGRALEVWALQNSAAASAAGRVVWAGLGRSEDLTGLDLNGAIALLERGDITFGDKVRNVAAAGAVGAVIYNQADENFRGLLQDPSSIPAAGLDGASGRLLAEQARAGELRAELVVDASIEETSSHNVVATLAGAEETVLLGAHYDSVAEGPGANDNASGTATVLELARTLATAEPGPTYRIVLFGAEEIGLLGSRFYVDSLGPQERERLALMLNFDMVGVGEQAMVGGTDELVQLVQQAAGEQGVQVGELGSGLDGRSDHAPFLEAGVPTLFFHRQDDPNYHTANDRSEYVAAEGIDVAGRLALAVMSAVTAAP